MLLKGDWITQHENLALIGPTGVGKSWLACTLGHKACRDNHSVLCTRLARLIDETRLAKCDGRIAARMKSLVRVDLLILDDWGLDCLMVMPGITFSKSCKIDMGSARRSSLANSRLPDGTN